MPSTSRSGTPSLTIFALGPLRIVGDAGPIDPSTWVRKKSRTLFGYLLCSRPRGVHKEQLMELLWPGTDPDRSAHSLQVALSDLRAGLGERRSARHRGAFIQRIGDRYSLDVGHGGWIDIEAFGAACEAGRRADAAGDAATAARHYTEAESLYAGDFLADEQFSDWAAARRERVRDEYVDALLHLLRHHEGAGRLHVAAEYARKALTTDPYIEACYRDLMRYAASVGDKAAVMRAYARCERAMREGFDSGVSAETKALADTLLGFSFETPAPSGRARLPQPAPHLARETAAAKRVGI